MRMRKGRMLTTSSACSQPLAYTLPGFGAGSSTTGTTHARAAAGTSGLCIMRGCNGSCGLARAGCGGGGGGGVGGAWA